MDRFGCHFGSIIIILDNNSLYTSLMVINTEDIILMSTRYNLIEGLTSSGL